MSIEPWRVKKYYNPRVLIGVADLLDPPLPDMTLVCLTGAELLILRNLLAYCHRKSTFVMTYGTEHYLIPDNETQDVVDAIVAELESKLMADCSDILERLDSLIAALEDVPLGLTSINDTLGLITDAVLGVTDQLSDNGEQLECICKRLAAIQQDPAVQGIVDAGLGDESLIPDDPYPFEQTPGEDAEACAVAQLTWYFMYETMTEIIQPAQDKAVAILLPLALATIATWIGTPLLGIPVGALLVLLWDLIEVWVEGRFSIVENAIFTNKDEIICAAYEVLRDTGNLNAAAEAVYDAVQDIPELSPLDSVCIRSLGCSWVMSRMAVAWANQTAWAVQRVSPGYCAQCGIIEGDDWYAVEIPQPEGDLEFDHTAGAYWLKHTYCAENLGSIVAYVGELVEFEITQGNGQLGWNNESAVDCVGSVITGTENINWDDPPYHYVYREFSHNYQQAHDALCPTALLKHNTFNGNWEDDPFAIQASMGWDCTGTALLRLHYIVYAKP